MTWRLLFLLILLCSPSLSAGRYPDMTTRRHWNKQRGYKPFKCVSAEGLSITNSTDTTIRDIIDLPDPVPDFSISFRAANISDNPQRPAVIKRSQGKTRRSKPDGWLFYLISSDSDTITFRIKTEEIPDLVSSEPALSITATYSGDKDIMSAAYVKDNIGLFSMPNSWEISVSNGHISIYAGNRSLTKIMEFNSRAACFSRFGFGSSPSTGLLVSDITLTYNASRYVFETKENMSTEKLAERFAVSTDPLEGFWTIFDRTLDEDLLRLGGDYRLAIVKSGDKYLIIYISGAQRNHDYWETGMIKGELIPDPFPGIYKVKWLDSEGYPMSKDIKAQTGEGNTLLIQFPYQSSALRLRRIPDNTRYE